MANQSTHLDVLVEGQSQTRTAINELLDPMSSAASFGRRASTTTGLTWGYYGGSLTKADGSVLAIANGTLSLTASSTCYVEVSNLGVVSFNTSAFTVGKVPLYTVTTGTATVTNYVDHRDGTQGNFQLQQTTFVASGASHAGGLVPDPGATAGTTAFLREDATWVDLGSAALLATDTDITLAANSDSLIATQKAVKQYVDAHSAGGGTTAGSYLISGGGVAFTSGLSLTVAAASYVIQGTPYTSAETPLTAATADPTNPRIDVLAFDATGPILITGTPAASPVKPAVDPATELEHTFFIVAAGASSLSVTTELIYDENTEATYTDSGTTLNPDSTTNPFSGTKDIEATSAVSGNWFKLEKLSGTWDLSAFDNLVFYIRSKAAWPSAKALVISWYNAGTAYGGTLSFKSGTYGFDSSSTSAYQAVVIPTSLFGVGSTAVNQIKFTVAGSGGSIGFYLDAISLQGGITSAAAGGDFSTNTTVSVDGELVLFSGTTGKLGKRGTLGAMINSATGKTTPVDADVLGLADSAASFVLKKLTWANLKATLKTYFDTLYAPVTQPFDVHAYYPGVPTASAIVVRVPIARAVTFPANFSGAYFAASANATATTVFDVQKNGSSIGSVSIAAGGTTATFTTTGGTSKSLVAGDVLSIIAPATADATLANPGFVLAGTR